MGGHAFDTKGLTVPRLPSSLHTQLVTHIEPILQNIFGQAVCPAPAPEKQDHGDLDFIVLESDTRSDAEDELISVLKGDPRLVVRNGPVTIFAIRHPKIPGAYVQLEIQYSPVKLFDWHVFRADHGYLASILGYLTRPVGLRLGESGIQTRGPPRSNALSCDPDAILTFLGLSPARYAEGFNTELEIFEYVMSGHLGWVDPSTAPNRSKDRRRLKREMYRKFVQDYLPTRRDTVGKPGVWADWNRVERDAMDFFGD